MESIGQKLISARESLGFTVEQIARDTNIAKSYLTALETEDFNSFPGETYLLGFLRNYSDYLGLVPDEMITLYRNMMIQEQPAPIEELLDTRKSLPKGAVAAIIIAIIIGLGAAIYFYIYPNYFAGNSSPVPVVEEPEQVEAEKITKVNIRDTYEFSDEVLEKRFRKEDAVSVVLDKEKYQLVIAEVEDAVTFVYSQGEFKMKAGEEALLDLNGDSAADIRLLLRSSDADVGSVVLHIDRFVRSAQPMSPGDENNPEANTPVIENSAALTTENASTAANTGRAGLPSREKDITTIRQVASPESFTLNIIFRGYCLMRYESDDGDREERYFHKGETFRLDVNSNVSLWASNAGTLASKVNGVDINLGGAGEVAAATIKWVYNSESSKYELQLIPIY